MSKENKNFTSTFKDLLGKKNEVVFEQEDNEDVKPVYSTNNNQSVSIYTESGSSNFKAKENYISTSSVFVGTIDTNEAISVDGTISGNMSSKDTLTLKGKIEGNVSAKIANVYGGAIHGDIKVLESILIDKDGIILGNITADSCVVDGKVKGDINCSGTVAIKNNAHVFGNICAKKINVLEGSVVCGTVKVLNEYQVSDENNFEKLLNAKINAEEISTVKEKK